MIETSAVGSTKIVTPHSSYRFWMPCNQISGATVLDHSGNNADATINVLNTIEWDNAGYFSTAESETEDRGAIIPAGDWGDYNYLTQSMILMFRHTGNVCTTSNKAIFGDTDAVSAAAGIRFLHTTAEKISINICDGTHNQTIASNTDVLTGKDHIAIVIDGTTQEVSLYADGVIDSTLNNAIFANIDASTASGNGFGILGSDPVLGRTSTLQVADIHCLVFDGALPSNIGALISRQALRPYHVIQESDF